MFEKTTEIINNSKPDSFLYMLWVLKKDSSGFYRRDDHSFEPVTFNDFFESAKDAYEAVFDNTICDENYVKDNTGLRCVRFALYKMNNEILDEIKNNILEDEYFYTQEWYDDMLDWVKKDEYYSNDPDFSEKAFTYTHLTEDFVKSWTYEDLLNYCEYNDRLLEGKLGLCKLVEYEKFIFVYDCKNCIYYVGSSDCKKLEDYIPSGNEEEYDD